MVKVSSLFGVLLVAAALNGCSKSEPMASAAPAPGGPAANAATPTKGPSLPSTSRKVIRNAELKMQVASTADAERRVSQLVERLGGYVASSEHQALSGAEPHASLSLRVPSARLEEALRELKQLSVGPQDEKVGSEDVTDEYIDLGASVANQVALEKQLTQILGQASNVDQAIKVQHELATVRTEIDRLQGRLRFMESETAMAKIALTLLPEPKLLAAAPITFWDELRHAAGESVEHGRAIFVGAALAGVHVVGVLVPLVLLVSGPVALGLWWRRRRALRLQAAG